MSRPPIDHAPHYPVQTRIGTPELISHYTDTPIDPDSGSGVTVRNRQNWVSHVTQLGPPELGPDNDQLFQSGHTSIIPVNPSNEQGIGRAGRFRWAHYPHVQQFNPTITSETRMLDGEAATALVQLAPFDSERGRQLRQPIWPEGYKNYRQQPDQKHVWPFIGKQDQAPSVSFTENVPSINDGSGW